MASDVEKWRAEFRGRTLPDLRFMRDAGQVTGNVKQAVLADAIREKEEAAEAERFQRQDNLNARSVTAAETSATASRRAAWATRFAAGAALLAAIATGGLVHIGWLQLEALERSDATQRGTNQAYVYFDHLELRPYPRPPDEVTVFGITVAVTNSGNTPALGVRFRFACPLAPKASAEEPFNLVDWIKVKTDPPMILGPKQSLSLQGCNLQPDQIAAAKIGKHQIFVVAEARYRDTFDPNARRITQTVQRLHFDNAGGHSFGFVGPHNCADEDCPK